MTIAILGDSLVQGYGLPADQGLVPQLQHWLDGQKAGIKLINAGVSGDTSAGGLSRLDWTLSPDVQGLVVALGGNDVLRGTDPAVTRANIDTILSKAAERHIPTLLVGMTAPGNYGPDYKAAFDAIFPELAEAHHALYYPGFFTPLLAQGQQAALATLIQPDGIHPNAAGVALIVPDFGPHLIDLARRIAAP